MSRKRDNKQDIKELKQQIQQVTRKQPAPRRNQAAAGVKTQQNAPALVPYDDEDEYVDGSDELGSDGVMDEQEDEVDIEAMDKHHETEDSDNNDFAEIKQSLRK